MGNVVHRYVKFFQQDETKEQLLKIQRINSWIRSQKSLSLS
jgi:hypothetical protein